MIIHGLLKRKSLTEALQIPNSMLRAISLDRNGVAYATCFEKNQGNEATIFLSQFDPHHWRDLWRFEIDFDDEFGLFDTLLGIFHQYGVSVLICETTKNDVLGGHTISAILDFHTLADEDNHDPLKILQYVEILSAEIRAKFIYQLSLRLDNRPRVRFRRIEVYQRLSEHFRKKQCPFPKLIPLSDSAIELQSSPIISSEMRENIHCKEYFYIPVLDTKDRIIRCQLRGSDRRIFHLKMVLRRHPAALKRAFSTLKSHDNHSAWNCEHIKIHNSYDGGIININEKNQYIVIDAIISNPKGTREGAEALLVKMENDEILSSADLTATLEL